MTGDVHDRIRDYWDRDSDTYDETRSHAISDPLEASAWRQALADALPEPGSKVLDVGAGTGALSLLAAELGYEVTALDLSPGMLGRAELKARERGLEERMRFVVGSGTEATEGPFDAVMERHVLWTLPDLVGALARLPSPVPLIDAVHEAGWSAVRIKRLRDVEWAAKLHEPWPLGSLEQRPRYTLVADA